MTLKEKYNSEVVPALKEEMGIKNSFAVPKMNKAVVNIGLGDKAKNDSYIENAQKTIEAITGQRPILTKARKSIAGFKIREGMVVGMRVTLRGDRMYAFIDKLINVTMPRIRDFRGLSPKMVDRQGNLSVGFRENLAFPEVNPDAVDTTHGLQVTINTSAETKEEGLLLFRKLGFPFQK